MSFGFHYLETMHNSLSLQWLTKEEAPKVLGQLLSTRAISNLLVLSSIYLYLVFFPANYVLIYLVAGGSDTDRGILLGGGATFEETVVQRTELFLRKKYWLYYVLTFLAGARRQIFVVFAGFLMVEKFGFAIENVVMLTLVNAALTLACSKNRLFNWSHWRKTRLDSEYLGLILFSFAML